MVSSCYFTGTQSGNLRKIGGRDGLVTEDPSDVLRVFVDGVGNDEHPQINGRTIEVVETEGRSGEGPSAMERKCSQTRESSC